MAADGPGAGRLPCPCRARRAARPQMAARRRILSALAVAGLAALAALPPAPDGDPAARVTLIVIAGVAGLVPGRLAVIRIRPSWYLGDPVGHELGQLGPA